MNQINYSSETLIFQFVKDLLCEQNFVLFHGRISLLFISPFQDKNVRNEVLARIDDLDEILLNDLFDGSEDEEGFSAAERLPLSLVTLLDDESKPMQTVDKGRYTSVKGFSKTRWHSILVMLESLGKQRAAVNRVIPTLKNPITINVEEWDLIINLVSFLKIFQVAVETLSSEKKATLSSALIFRIEIESTLTPDDKDHYIIAELKEKMMSSLDHRFPITDEILIGTILDPRLQNLPRLQSELDKKNVTKFEFLKNVISKILPTTQKSNSGDQSGPSTSVPKSPEKPGPSKRKQPPKKKQPSILSTLIKKHAYASNQEATGDRSKVDEEIHKYFLTTIPTDEIDDFNVLSFWKSNKRSLPLLGELVKKILCIPMTSTSSERAFSYAGILISAKRSCLSPYVVEKTLFIHDNYDLVKLKLFVNIDC